MRKLVAAFAVIFLVSQAIAKPIVWDGRAGTLPIADKLDILEDPDGKLTFEQVSSPEYKSKFTPSEKVILNLGYTESIFWLRFTVDNQASQSPMLALGQACLPFADLYYVNDSGKVVSIKSGFQIPLDEKLVKDHFQVFPLPAGIHEYYVRLFTNSGPIPVKLYTPDTYRIASITQKLVYGFYMGFMFFLMLSNLFFFFSLRNKMHLFYAFNVVLYASYAALVVDGFAPYIFHGIDLLFWYTTIPTIGVTVQTIYCVKFLEVQKYLPKLNRFTWGVIAYFGTFAIAKFFLPFTVVLAVMTANALISFFLMGYVGYRVGKKGNRMGYYFALAYFIYFLLVLTEATYIQTGVPPYFSELSHTAFATLAEAIILSFLLSRRLEWEKRDAEKARAEAQQLALDTTLENERIVREQNVILEQKVADRTHQLQLEKQKSDDLLHNILPEEIAEELKSKGTSEARLYEHVTVIFADFVNFTGISSLMSPTDLVHEIDKNFTRFDKIAEKYGLEKIKTIGDAYLAVCGLPNEIHDHAQRVIKAAMEMTAWMKQHDVKFQIRIGVHSGPVVAGIVGVKKFAYDIWGDTVNMASRMESSSEPMTINISGATYELVKKEFNCVYRGKVEVKNKGGVDMYFVTDTLTVAGDLSVAIKDVTSRFKKAGSEEELA
jgi:class 3 adenylate cyclase